MHSLVRTVFSRLHTLDPAIEEAKLQASEEDAPDSAITMTVSTQTVPLNDEPSELHVNIESEIQDPATPVPSDEPPSPVNTQRSECTSLNSWARHDIEYVFYSSRSSFYFGTPSCPH